MTYAPVGKPGNRVLDHFKSFEDFESELGIAEGKTKTIDQKDFVAGLKGRYAQYRATLYLSQNQADWLRRIANMAD